MKGVSQYFPIFFKPWDPLIKMTIYCYALGKKRDLDRNNIVFITNTGDSFFLRAYMLEFAQIKMLVNCTCS